MKNSCFMEIKKFKFQKFQDSLMGGRWWDSSLCRVVGNLAILPLSHSHQRTIVSLIFFVAASNILVGSGYEPGNLCSKRPQPLVLLDRTFVPRLKFLSRKSAPRFITCFRCHDLLPQLSAHSVDLRCDASHLEAEP